MPTTSDDELANLDAPAIIEASGRIWTRRKLNQQANQLARALRQAGLNRADAIAIIAPNCAEFLAAYLAVLQIGMYLIPINWHLTSSEVRHILSDVCPKAVIVHERLEHSELRTLLDAQCTALVRVAIGHMEGYVSWSDFLEPHASAPLSDRIPGRVTFYSSATTGRPKAVFQPLESAEFEPIRTLRLSPAPPRIPDVHLCTTVLYHAGGLLHTATAVHLGHCIVLMETWSPESMLKLIEQHQVTTTFAVPTMFVRLLKLADEVRRRYDHSSLVQVIHAAAPCPTDTKRDMLAWWGPILWECYNGTEGQGTFISPEDWIRYPGAVGRPFPGVRLRILDDDGEDLPTGSVGNIYLSDLPGCRFEYRGDPVKTASTRRGDFYTMGDVGYVNSDGYLFICDRRRDIINCGGEKIYPAEIEQSLVQHPAVLDCAAISSGHAVLGEVPVVFVQLQSTHSPTKALTAELMQFLMKRIALIKIPRSIEYVAAIPRAPNGKLYRRLLQDRHES